MEPSKEQDLDRLGTNVNTGNDNDGSSQRLSDRESPDKRPRKRVRRNNDKPPYRNHDHASQALAKLNAMREQSSLCDVVLVIDDGSEVPVHKYLLAACSEYFLAMFTNFEERHQSRIELHGVDYLTLKLLLDYVYTAEIQITEENVEHLLAAANLLQFPDLKVASCDFLLAQLHPSNCLGIQKFADTYGCLDLLETTNSYINEYFSEIVKEDEFLRLDHQRVAQLIGNNRLRVLSEEIVFESVISWVYVDLESRKSFFPQLMEHVRLALLHPKYLFQRVKEESLVKDSFECQKFLIEVLGYHSLKNEKGSLFKSIKTKLRLARQPTKVLSVSGTFGNNKYYNTEYFDFEEGKWHQMSELPQARFGTGSSVLEDRLYVTGGRCGKDEYFSRVDVYDSFTNRWSNCAEMKSQRGFHGVAVLGECIYAVGGFGKQTFLNSAEVYDPSINEWRWISPMIHKRVALGVGVVGGMLYVVGGYNGSFGNHRSVECYNPKEDKWKLVEGTSIPRRGVGVGVLDEIIYAVGGCDNKTVHKSVEAYDPKIGHWKPIPDMKERRKLAGVVAFNGLLYVVGGEDENKRNLTSVEVYSPETKSWTMLPNSMSSPKSFANVVIMKKPRVQLSQM